MKTEPHRQPTNGRSSPSLFMSTPDCHFGLYNVDTETCVCIAGHVGVTCDADVRDVLGLPFFVVAYGVAALYVLMLAFVVAGAVFSHRRSAGASGAGRLTRDVLIVIAFDCCVRIVWSAGELKMGALVFGACESLSFM